MSVEERLTLLLAQARESGGADAYGDLSALRSRLSTTAPDLHGEIQALTAALANGVPARIAAAPDPAAERAAAAAQIAREEKLSMAVVTPALAVACRSAADFAPSVRAADTDPWAGDSMMVGADPPPPGAGFRAAPLRPAPPFHPQAAPPHYPVGFPNPQGPATPPGRAFPPQPPGYGGPYQPPPREPDPWNSYDMSGRPQPFYTKVWFFLAIGLLIVGGAILYSQWNNLFGRGAVTKTADADRPNPTPQPQPQPQPAQPPPAETLFRPGGPVLSRTDDGPFITVQQAPDGRRGLSFAAAADDGRIEGVLVLPARWDEEATLVGTNADGSRSVGTGRFVLDGSADRPVRRMRVRWRQDGLGAGATGVAVVGVPGQSDVVLPGAAFCLMNDTTGEAVACGQIR